MRLRPIGRCPKTTKTDKNHGSRQESHPLSDRPTIDWPCRPDYAATISFGLPFEPEDSQYGKYRLELVILQLIGYTGMYRSRTGMFDEAVKLVPWEQGS